MKPAAFLWDESYLWGIMAHQALVASGLAFELIRSDDVRNGVLSDYALLFVPGGWASNKMKALGSDGVDEIRRFVREGGAYLGFCGGAGLATMDGIGLLPVKRRPTKERVPSFSGRIKLSTSGHPIWQGAPGPVFHAWWPSQFVVEGDVSTIATYGEAMPDAFSSDVNVGDAEAAGSWPELERLYQINLDPKRLLGEPAVVEGSFGKGKVLLSLVHFDTPADASGAAVLKNIWLYLAGNSAAPDCIGTSSLRVGNGELTSAGQDILRELEAAVSSLIALGERNFLWFRRNPLLLQWRRGVRGLEYCTLYVMINEIGEIRRRRKPENIELRFDEQLERVRSFLVPFVQKAKQLLVLERFALQNGHITYDKCDDPVIQSIREELFSRSKSHGGIFKELIDEVDGLLYSLIQVRS